MKTQGNTMRKLSAMLTISKENDIGDDTIQAVVLRQRAQYIDTLADAVSIIHLPYSSKEPSIKIFF